jgi:hypothetical protein
MARLPISPRPVHKSGAVISPSSRIGSIEPVQTILLLIAVAATVCVAIERIDFHTTCNPGGVMVAYCAHRFFRIPLRCFLPLAALLLLSGCMHPPHFPRRVSVAEVVHNARCELYEAISQNIHDYPWIENWSAGFNFSFVVDRHMDASTDTTYLVPVQYGTFALGIEAGLRQNAKGTFVVDFSITNGLGHFSEADCVGLREDAETPRRLLNGEIGLRRWLNEVIPQMEAAWIAPETEWEPEYRKRRREYAGNAKQLGYTIEFGVTASGNLLPSWDLTYSNGHQFRPAFDFGVSRIATQTLIVALAPIEPPGPLDLSGIVTMFEGKEVIMGRRVCVTNIEQAGQCFFDKPDLRREMEATARQIRKSKDKKKNAETAENLAVEQRDSAERDARSFASNPEMLAAARDRKKQANAAIQNAKRAQAAASAEIEALQARQRGLRARFREYQAVGKEAEARAMAEARRKSQAATDQRLQQIIQQQIIRDAFRR